MKIDALARDYFAKQEAYRAACNKARKVTTDESERIALELALRDALDACVEASLKLDEARRQQMAAE